MTVKKLRQKDCLSQEQLAEKTGLSLRTIQRAESGRQVSHSSLRTLADYFEVPPEELLPHNRKLSLAEIAGVSTMRDMSRHRAIQLIMFVVTFFVCNFQWLAYYAYLKEGLNEASSDASLAYMLGIVAGISLAAALLAWIFSLARKTFVRVYYSTFGTFLLGSILLSLLVPDGSGSPSAALVYPVYFSVMLLAQLLILVLQLALSLKGETTVLVQRYN